jgi:hypothetical protein
MGSTILRALARQGHPTSPAGLRTYREAAGANPCAQALLVSRATRFRRSRVARTSGSRLGFAQRTGPIPRCQRGNRCRSRRKPVPRGAPLRVCPQPRSYGPEGMRSCERTADDEHPVAARPRPAVAVGSPGDIVASARWLDRLNVLVGQWPQSQAFGRRLLCGRGVPPTKAVAGVPHNHRLLQTPPA